MNVILELIVGIFAIIYFCIESFVLLFIPNSWKKKDITDDTVLVTGAGSGIGRLLSLRFAKLGCTVVLWDVNQQSNKETENLIKDDGGKAFAYTCDLTNKDEIYKTAERVKEDVGPVSILVNNAGIVTGKRLVESPDHMIQRTFAVNVLAHFWTTKAFLPDMIAAKKGHIVTIASIAGLCGGNSLVDYSSSKFAAVGFDDALRMELQVDGYKNIETTVVCPYFITTGMFDGFYSKILPPLVPEDVANDIMNAVLTNTKMIVLPKYCYLFVILKMLMPVKVYNQVYSMFGGEKSMESFRGRDGGVKSD